MSNELIYKIDIATYKIFVFKVGYYIVKIKTFFPELSPKERKDKDVYDYNLISKSFIEATYEIVEVVNEDNIVVKNKENGEKLNLKLTDIMTDELYYYYPIKQGK